MWAWIARNRGCAAGASRIFSGAAKKGITRDAGNAWRIDMARAAGVSTTLLRAAPSTTNLRWLWLSLVVIVADQLTKHWILASFHQGEDLRLTSFASLVLAFNRGAAFSFLAGEDGWQRWLFA